MRVAWIAAAVLLLCVVPLWLLAAPPPPERGPLNVANLHDVAAVASTDLLASALAPNRVGAYRITAIVNGASSTLSFMVARAGTGTMEARLNGGASLAAPGAYTFTLGCHPDYTYQVQVGTTTTLDLLVDEIQGGEL